MKPLNIVTETCDPVSSNCVVWQGPDIECLSLCRGDSVSDVVFKMATELCTIMTALNVTSYDLSCFNLKACAPKDFTELLQFIMERVCKLEGCTGCNPDCDGVSTLPPAVGGLPGCPNCDVIISPCFYYINALGDQVTTMQLTDYVTALGNKICGIIEGTVTIQSTLQNQGARLINLENAEPIVTPIPFVTPSCVLPTEATAIDVVIQALESQFCQLRGSTGLPNQLFFAIDKQPAGLTLAPALSFPGTMGSIPGWASTVNNVADSFTNMWLTIDDMRKAIVNIKTNCCPSGCDGVLLNLSGYSIDGNNIKLYITGTIPTGFLPCSGNTLFTITDALNNTYQYPIDIPVYLNNPGGVSINLTATPVNGSSNLTISAIPCLTNATTNATCESVLNTVIINQNNCPVVVVTSGLNDVNYSIPVTTANTTYTVELWNNTNSVLLQTFVHNVVIPAAISGSFLGLTGGTSYNVRVKLLIGTIESTCPFMSVTTFPAVCPPPTTVVSTMDSPLVFLGAACGFGVLAGTTVTNTGATTINGDLGLDPGSAITGAPVVTGSTEVNTVAAINAKADLVNAYNQAFNAPMTTDMSGIDLGGQTLTPGVYFFNAGAVITGAVTLNGAGTYIFQITTTLVTNGGINVILTGGATAENVFWQVGSSATLNTGTTFKGIIMALTSISVDGGTIDGALMARNGAVTFTAGTTVNYLGC